LKLENKYLRYAHQKLIKPFKIQKEDFILEESSNLFLSGLTGRTGSTWMLRLLADLGSEQNYVPISETGVFVLSQFRHAAYEYYQATPGNALNHEKYLKFFYKFLTKWAYNRRKIYGTGLQGLKLILPKIAIRQAYNDLKERLSKDEGLSYYFQCFGKFYSNLLNYHSLLQSNSLKWISKEPGYARHAYDLYRLIPDSKNIILLRDGRDVALSMSKRGWLNGDVKKCMLRWKHFSKMTLESISKVPKDNFYLVRYEDLIENFEDDIYKILEFYNIPPNTKIEDKISRETYKYKPKDKNFDKWKNELTQEEKQFFTDNCSEILTELGY